VGTDNIISIEVTPEDKTAIETALTSLQTTLGKYVIVLTPDQKKEMAKMSDKSIAFVEKVSDYKTSNPEFVPAYMNTAEFDKDLKAVQELRDFQRVVEQQNSSLVDTITLCGSEAYRAALGYYNSVKQAAKMNVPAAADIYADLKKRFVKTTVTQTNPE
jgi:hypothetical protein